VVVLFVAFISTNQPAHASNSSVDKLDIQISDRKSPEFQNIQEAQPTISLAITPQIITLGEMATVAVRLNNVPAAGYTSIEITCSYYPDLIEASDIVVADLFGADPVVAIRGPQPDHFIVAIAGSHGNKATDSGTVITFHARGLQRGIFPLECQARVSTGDHVLTDITSISHDILVLGPTPTSTTGFCDSAEFIADVNIPPGTVMAPGAQFRKTWRLKNVGTCAWTTSYQLVFFGGEQMNVPSHLVFSRSVEPGAAVDISVQMTAPSIAGSYHGDWMFKNANGALFGIGPQANEPFSVDIIVSGATATSSASTHSPTPSVTLIPSITPGGPTATPVAGVAFDFAANVCTAVWFSGAGRLPCPGNDGDLNGFVLKLNNLILETGVTDARPGILTFPQNVQSGYIQGFYPPFHVQNGDRFRSIITCEGGATSCYVAFRLDYQVGSDSIKTFWGPFLERYDGRYYSVDVDLSPLAGNDVKFILTLISAGSPIDDRALWVGPIIYRADTGTTPIPVVSLTPTPSESPTATPLPDVGVLTGQVHAEKPVTLSLYRDNAILVTSATANADGTFNFTIPAGIYLVFAEADGFLGAEGFVTISAGGTSTMPVISLLAGDIDGNDRIDQFDVLTIGMNYNKALPSVADLNNDGIINVLDLELLAGNYRKAGFIPWNDYE
jgi:hypothetical protein